MVLHLSLLVLCFFNNSLTNCIEQEIIDESEDLLNSVPGFLGQSVHNIKAGLYQKFIIGTSGEKSYLKVYINVPEKTWAFYENKLNIVCWNGKLYSINVSCQGNFSIKNKELVETDLVSIKQGQA